MRRALALPVAALIFTSMFLENANSLDRPLQPNWYKANFKLLQDAPNSFVKWQEATLNYAREKERQRTEAFDQISFDLKSFPIFSTNLAIGIELRQRVTQIKTLKEDLESSFLSLQAKGLEYEKVLKFGYGNIEAAMNVYQNGSSNEDYAANKVPRASIIGYEIPPVFSSDWSDPIYFKVRIKTYQPILVYAAIDREGQGGSFYVNQVPSTINEYRDKYDQIPGSTGLVNARSAMGGIRLLEEKTWTGDALEETHIFRLDNSQRTQFDRISIYVQERSTVDCLFISFKRSHNLDGSGGSDCLALGPKRPNELSVFGQKVTQSLVEKDFNAVYEVHKRSHEIGLALNSLVDYPDQYLLDLKNLKSKSLIMSQDARLLEKEIVKFLAIADFKATANKKTTITCSKGKVSKRVTAIMPKCPSGYRLKK
jgi:hypothetical protein